MTRTNPPIGVISSQIHPTIPAVATSVSNDGPLRSPRLGDAPHDDAEAAELEHDVVSAAEDEGVQHDAVSGVEVEGVQHDAVSAVEDEGGQHDAVSTVEAEGVQHDAVSTVEDEGGQHDATIATDVARGVDCIWSPEVPQPAAQQSCGPAKAASEIKDKPNTPINAGVQRPCRRQPGTKASKARTRQTATIHWWKDGSARKLSPSNGRKPTTKGMAAQWMAHATEAVTPSQSP